MYLLHFYSKIFTFSSIEMILYLNISKYKIMFPFQMMKNTDKLHLVSLCLFDFFSDCVNSLFLFFLFQGLDSVEYSFKEYLSMNHFKVYLLKTTYATVMQQLRQQLPGLNIVSKKRKKCLEQMPLLKWEKVTLPVNRGAASYLCLITSLTGTHSAVT